MFPWRAVCRFDERMQYAVVYVINWFRTIAIIKLYPKIVSAWLLIDNGGTFSSAWDSVNRSTAISSYRKVVAEHCLLAGDLFQHANNGTDVIKRYDALQDNLFNCCWKSKSREVYGAYPTQVIFGLIMTAVKQKLQLRDTTVQQH